MPFLFVTSIAAAAGCGDSSSSDDGGRLRFDASPRDAAPVDAPTAGGDAGPARDGGGGNTDGGVPRDGAPSFDGAPSSDGALETDGGQPWADGGWPFGEACGERLCAAGAVCCEATCGLCGATTEECAELDCGGDGGTYGRACGGFAALSCSTGEFCDYSGSSPACGATDATGVCNRRPASCTDMPENAACGCDGRSYRNPCEAALAGTSVARFGTCDDTPSCDAEDAIGRGACDTVLGARWNGTACETIMGCECVGSACPGLSPSAGDCRLRFARCGQLGGSFACLSSSCATGREYCYITTSGGVERASCVALPSTCDAVPSCASCFPSGFPGGSCTSQSRGEVTVRVVTR